MSIYHIKVFLNPVAAYWFACRYILLFILLIRFQFIPGCFPFCPTNSHKSVELSRENESNRGIHLLFDWNFDFAWQSRTGNENFWKWNSAIFGWTGPDRPARGHPPWSWTTSTGKFPCGPKRSIYFSTEISEYFDIRKAPPTRRIPQCLRQGSISYGFHHVF